MSIKPKTENNELLNLVLAVAIIMGFIFTVSISIYFIRENYGLSCRCKLSLPIVISILTSLGVFVGILTYYFISKSFNREKTKIFGNIEKTLNFLEIEEKKIILALIKKNGETMQNNLSNITGIDPVKLHRRLINLENKGVLKKQKNGMTNKIILQEDFKTIFLKDYNRDMY
jgi:hypothetical protein